MLTEIFDFKGVARVWEKMEERIKEFGAKRPAAAKKIINWAKNAALEHHMARMYGKPGMIIRAQALVISSYNSFKNLLDV